MRFFHHRNKQKKDQEQKFEPKRSEVTMLPVQALTFGIARPILESARRGSDNIAQIMEVLSDKKPEVSRKIMRLKNREDLDGYFSSITDGSITDRFGSLWLAVAEPTDENIRNLILLSLFYIEIFVEILYPENPYVWTETDFETAKAEAKFGHLILGALMEELGGSFDSLCDIDCRLAVISKELDKTTYVGQTMRLQSSIAIMQLELVNQQSTIMKRFDEQDKRMSCMTKVINVCSIVAAVATVLSLVVQLRSCS